MQDEVPLVSVLMTAYNREQYIAGAIESVLASSYKNFELIISDDASVDNTVNIAKEFERKDPRIKIFVNKNNLGDYFNRNKAASYAEGKYLKYLDSDDHIYPYSLEIMVKCMEEFPLAGYAFSDMFVQDDASPFPILLKPMQAFRQHFLNNGLFYAGPGGTIIRRSAFTEVKGFSGKRFLGDTELLMKIALLHPILKIQPGLIWWRIHKDQEAAAERKSPEIIAQRYQLMIELLNLSPLSINEKKSAKHILDKLMARNIFRQLIIKFNFSVGIKMIKCAGFNANDLLKAFYIKNKMRKILSGN